MMKRLTSPALPNPRAAQLNGVNTAPADQVEQAENLVDVLREMRGHLRALNTPKPARRLVDIYDSEPAASSITLRQTRSALCLVDRVIYSISGAGTLQIGKRQIAIPAAGVFSLACHELALNFDEVVSMTLGTGTGALHLEIIGWQVSPAERLEVIS